jgi:hypothetical protein
MFPMIADIGELRAARAIVEAPAIRRGYNRSSGIWL